MCFAPTGGGSLALAGAGVEVATAVAVGEAAVVTGTGVMAAGAVGHAMSTNPQYQGGSYYVDKDKNTRVDWEYNGNGSGNVHYEVGSDQSSKITFWRITEDGVGEYIASKAADKLLSNPKIAKFVEKSINIILQLAGIEPQ